MTRTRGAAWRLVVSTLAVAGLIGSAADSGMAAAPRPVRSSERELISAAEADLEGEHDDAAALRAAAMYSAIRTAPKATAPKGALVAAEDAAARIPVIGGAWDEVTDLPYNSDDQSYRDPVYSNSGGGSQLVTGRVNTLAVDGDTIYAGGGNGGVWVSRDAGKTWKPTGDDLASTSSGAIAVDPDDHSVWYGTGEMTTGFSEFLGAGVFRSSNGGKTWQRIGRRELDNTLISQIAFGADGRVFLSTSHGLYFRSANWKASRPWEELLVPGKPSPYGMTFANDVAAQPGTGGKVVIATFGWRSAPTDYRGFYESRRWGDPGTWKPVHPRGDLKARYVGRATFAYASDGSRLYALVEAWQSLASTPSALYGVFVSDSGDVAGPWNKIAGPNTLAHHTGSALKSAGAAYKPGVQAWYNQALAVDPRDPEHVYVGLEEVYETTDAGKRWRAIGPYWNFTLPCFKDGTCSPNGTHPDQHDFAIAGGNLYVGNDGGVYRVGLRTHEAGKWKSLNRDLRMLQYYGVAVGTGPEGDVYWGGMQDNGVSLLQPGMTRMVSPFGGDGGFNLVDPTDPDRAVVEYVDLDMALTTNGGASDGATSAFREISPSCFAFTYTPDPCDPGTQFIAPFVADPTAVNTHWIAGGQYVWETFNGWNTSCSADACDWKIVHDTGDGNSTTALGINGSTMYAGWCTLGCDPGPTFATGIDTNSGGSWHQVAGPDVTNGGVPLPQRYITAITVDPADPANVYVTYGGFRRRWNFVPGSSGHVFQSTDGGTTWNGITGNLPDIAASDIVVADGQLIVGMDVGAFVADAADPSSWSRLGTGLPNTAIWELTLSPDGGSVVAATHGRGIWRVPLP